jgi:hypothetical protein
MYHPHTLIFNIKLFDLIGAIECQPPLIVKQSRESANVNFLMFCIIFWACLIFGN